MSSLNVADDLIYPCALCDMREAVYDSLCDLCIAEVKWMQDVNDERT